MKLYLMNSENIYFPKIKEYFQEIVSSYDNGNYRSALVMLYSTIVCDLLLKLKELSDVYNDKKAENILKEVNEERNKYGNSAWEWKLINSIHERTELLSDEAYTTISHVYNLRNFSAHPAMNDDYELISPTPEITVAYIKKTLEDIFVKPSVFADNIVNRMSDDISARKELFRKDYDGFILFLDKVYFQRMSPKMITKVFTAFWKFTFVKTKEDGEVFEENRNINRKTLEAMLSKYSHDLFIHIEQNKSYFRIAGDASCMAQACVLFSFFPQLYRRVEEAVRYQIDAFKEKDVRIIKWFEVGDLEAHLNDLRIRKDFINPKILDVLEQICKRQGQPKLFTKFLVDHYERSNSYTYSRDCFDYMIEPYLNRFSAEDIIRLIEIISSNDQIYGYIGQRTRNNTIMGFAELLLPSDFDYSVYEKFRYTKTEEPVEEMDELSDIENEDDTELPF